MDIGVKHTLIDLHDSFKRDLLLLECIDLNFGLLAQLLISCRDFLHYTDNFEFKCDF